MRPSLRRNNLEDYFEHSNVTNKVVCDNTTDATQLSFSNISNLSTVHHGMHLVKISQFNQNDG